MFECFMPPLVRMCEDGFGVNFLDTALLFCSVGIVTTNRKLTMHASTSTRLPMRLSKSPLYIASVWSNR